MTGIRIKYHVLLSVSLLWLSVLSSPSVHAQQTGTKSDLESPLKALQSEINAYFEPVTGKITAVEGDVVTIEVEPKESVKAGMRLNAFKEGVSFIHPVTKESLGRVEIPVGIVELREVGDSQATGQIISGKTEDFAHASIKVPRTKIKVLFYQGTVDWYLGDAYYQMLKESGRYEVLDAGHEANDIGKVLSEARAKSAEAVIAMSSEQYIDRVELMQRLYWVSDAKEFSEKKVSVNVASVKDLKFKAGAFGPKEGEALLSFSLKSGARKLAVGDFEGDGNPDILLVAGDTVRVYRPGAELKLLHEFKVPSTKEVLWIDTISLNGSKKDSVLITSFQDQGGTTKADAYSPPGGGAVTSYVYQLKGTDFVQVAKFEDTFIRRMGKDVIEQEYHSAAGFDGKVFFMNVSDGSFRKGDALKLPPGINIYDFHYISSPFGKQGVIAWDEAGTLSFYNEQGLRTWTSNEDFGGAQVSFKKDSSIMMVEKGVWSVKNKLADNNGEILVPKRIPLLGVARGLGYKESQLKSIWWNGMTVEQRVFIEDISGEILDYAVVGDRLLVLSKPLFGLQPKNILKGENPIVTNLQVFSLKGR